MTIGPSTTSGGSGSTYRPAEGSSGTVTGKRPATGVPASYPAGTS